MNGPNPFTLSGSEAERFDDDLKFGQTQREAVVAWLDIFENEIAQIVEHRAADNQIITEQARGGAIQAIGQPILVEQHPHEHQPASTNSGASHVKR